MKKLILTMILFLGANCVFSQTKPVTPVTPVIPSKPVTPASPAAPAKPAVPSRPSVPSKPYTPSRPVLEDDQTTYTFITTQSLTLMNSSSTTYFSLAADTQEAYILEIIPVNETMCRLTVAIPEKENTFLNFNIYIKKGEILGIKSKGQVYIGSLESFDYNNFAILGKCF